MATLPNLNQLENNTPADATEVMYNFDSLKDFLTTSVLHKDGGTLTGTLTLPAGNPPASYSAAHKAYVDAQKAAALAATETATEGPYVHVRPDGTIDDAPLQEDVSGWTTVKFGDVQYQVGNSGTSNGYQTDGSYKAPKVGLYLVSATLGANQDQYVSSRILVNDTIDFFGPRVNFHDLVATNNPGSPDDPGLITFSHVVRITAVDQLIEVQINPTTTADFRAGKALTVTWLRPNA